SLGVRAAGGTAPRGGREAGWGRPARRRAEPLHVFRGIFLYLPAPGPLEDLHSAADAVAHLDPATASQPPAVGGEGDAVEPRAGRVDGPRPLPGGRVEQAQTTPERGPLRRCRNDRLAVGRNGQRLPLP